MKSVIPSALEKGSNSVNSLDVASLDTESMYRTRWERKYSAPGEFGAWTIRRRTTRRLNYSARELFACDSDCIAAAAVVIEERLLGRD